MNEIKQKMIAGEDKIQTLSDEIELLNDKLAQKEAIVEKAEQRIDYLKNEVFRGIVNCEELQDQINQREFLLEETKGDISEGKRKSKLLLKNIQGLKKEISNREMIFKDSMQRNVEQQIEFAKILNKISKIEESANKRHILDNEIFKNLSVVNKQILEYLNKILLIEEKIKDYEQNFKRFDEYIHTLEKREIQYKTQIDRLNNQNSDYTKMINVTAHRLMGKSLEIDKLNTQLSDYLSQLEAKDDIIESLKDYNNIITVYEEKVHSLENETSQLKQEILFKDNQIKYVDAWLFKIQNSFLYKINLFFRLLQYYKNNRTVKIIRKSGIFDVDYYKNSYPDVAQSGVDPIIHFIQFGAKEGRNPNDFFDTKYYLCNNPDVAEEGINPLLHYLQYGTKEYRNPHPFFDTRYYLENNDDVRKDGINPLTHYIRFGKKEARKTKELYISDGSSMFNYRTDTTELTNTQVDPYLSWLEVNEFNDRRRQILEFTLNSSSKDLGPKYLSFNYSSLNNETYFVGRFKKILSNFEIVTFDIFDTLVERNTFHPTDIFHIMELDEYIKNNCDFKFAEQRILAENDARAASDHEEITLKEIYDTLQEKTLIIDKVKNKLIDLEVEYELLYVSPKKLGKKLYDEALAAKKDTYFISDIYLGTEVIQKILNKCLYNHVDTIYLSSTCRKTKHTGNLFKHFLEAKRLKPEKIMHVGDNPHSDGVSARNHGIFTFLIPKPTDELFQNTNIIDKQGHI